MRRVLIVEDEVFTAIDLEVTVAEISAANVVVKTSVADTKEALRDPFDFAILDIDVTNGTTYEVAQILNSKKIPFVFVSAARVENMPNELRDIPLIRKPFKRSDIERVLKSALPT